MKFEFNWLSDFVNSKGFDCSFTKISKGFNNYKQITNINARKISTQA